MNKKNKLTILSIITSSIILTSNIPINHTSNFYTSKYYDIPQDNIINELTLADENQNFIPEDNYIPQGIAIIGTDIIISSFDFYKEKNSILCIYNEQGQLINKCTLEHKAHVGGIAYDSINNLLWVTAQSGNIIAYDIDDIYNKKHPISKCKEIYVGENLTNYLYPWLTSASFLTVHNNEIFVGNFSLNNVGTIKTYKIESTNDNITLNYVSSFKIPNKVQGITFYQKNDKEYIIFSRSYGRTTSSILQIFKYDKNIKDYNNQDLKSASLKLEPMLEQIVTNDSNIYGVYEKNAKPYSTNQKQDFDSIIEIEISDTIKKLELKIDTN